MKVELHINGRYEIELAPENELERVMLAEMAERPIRAGPYLLSFTRRTVVV